MTGEYAVLHGARALALPSKLGQKMTVKNARGSDLIWEALDPDGEVWFDAQLSLYDFSAIKTSDEEIASTLRKILRAAVQENSEFLSTWSGFKVETQLEFPKDWGLGSSSSLLSNVAQWADINAFHLYFHLFNGSGYDIACAQADEAILYELGEENLHFNEIDFSPSFTKHIYFIWQGKKQNSETSLKIHSRKFKNKPDLIAKISKISEDISQAKSLTKFHDLIEEHDELISETLDQERIQKSKYPDFDGKVKSLGAWGGDFLMASSDKGGDYIKKYFSAKGHGIILPWSEIIL